MQKINTAPPVPYYSKYTKKQCKQIKFLDILTFTTKKSAHWRRFRLTIVASEQNNAPLQVNIVCDTIS